MLAARELGLKLRLRHGCRLTLSNGCRPCIAGGIHIVLADGAVHLLECLGVGVALLLLNVAALDVVVHLLPQDMQRHEASREGPEGG